MYKAYIYKITNLINNKLYIGSTIKSNPNQRWSQHKSSARTGGGYQLHQAMRKHGIHNFKFEVIFIVLDKSYLDEIEDRFILEFNSLGSHGYNGVGVLKGGRNLIQKTMRNEWADPKKRKNRIIAMQNGTKHRFIPIVSVCTLSSNITRYESVHSAMRAGFSSSSIYGCLTGGNKTGQKHCWFYDDLSKDRVFVEKALKLIGRFKFEQLKPFYGVSKLTLNRVYFNKASELKESEFKWKGVHRAIKRGMAYKGYNWYFGDVLS